MIGDISIQMRISGTRLILIRLRFAILAPSANARDAWLIGRPPSPERRFDRLIPRRPSPASVSWPVSVRNTSSRVGRRKPDVDDGDVRVAEVLEDLLERVHAAVHGGGQRAGLLVDLHLA